MIDGHHSRLGVSAAGVGDDRVNRQDDRDSMSAADAEDPASVVDARRLGKAAADLDAVGLQEGVRHPATKDDRIYLMQEMADHPELVGDLRAPEDGDECRRGASRRLDSAVTSRSIRRPA